MLYDTLQMYLLTIFKLTHNNIIPIEFIEIEIPTKTILSS